MKLEKGKILDLRDAVVSKKGYTISKAITKNAVLFSLGKDTDITPERYKEDKVFYILEGKVEIQNKKVDKGEIYRANIQELLGLVALDDTVLLEMTIEGDGKMALESGKVFKLQDLIEYTDGSIANLDLIKKDGMKFVLLSFDEGEGLAPHSAPVNAMVMALEGKAKVTMGDIEAEIEGGEQFVFEKDIDHSVTAITKFKMALLMA